jgi:hypothetical protein
VSRRHHGARPHRTNGHARPDSLPRAAQPTLDPARPAAPQPAAAIEDLGAPVEADPAESGNGVAHDRPLTPPESGGSANGQPPTGQPANGFAPPHGHQHGPPDGIAASTGCTAPQLRRFIKSRPYVPMHELRRRFGIDGGEDDVVLVELGSGSVFVGLPPREGALLGELLRGGEVGYELSLDPRSPVVVGLYPMRPIARA